MRTDVFIYESPSKFDTLGTNLLQAVANSQPVAGGLRYAEALVQCQLDGSLDSLKKIDRLLTSIRRDLVRQGQGQSELKAADFRNFVLYAAFYAGEVAKGAMTDKAHRLTWQSSEVFATSYPAINTKSFYQLMALTATNGRFSPLFLLQNIGARLFGSIQNTFVSPMDNEPVAESVFWAVNDWLVKHDLLSKDEPVLPLSNAISQNDTQSNHTHQSVINPHEDVHIGTQNLAAQTIQAQTVPTKTEAAAVNPVVQTAQATQATQATMQGLATQNNQTTKPTQKPVAKPKKAPADIFVEVKSDLSALPASNDTQQVDYQKAAAMVDRVEGLIALHMQDKDLAYQDVPVGEKAKALRQSGIKLLLQVAKAGNTNAMIKLALCYFEGRGVPQDDEKGVQLIKMAAEKSDNRAQKLLSKLYYQGIGVTQNVSMGEMWLDKAAAGGHPEAKKIKSYMTQIQLMRDDYRVENQKDKQFIIGLSLAGVVLIFAIWMSVKFI